MSTHLSPPPERDLPPGRQARRRQQLVTVIRSEERPAVRRRWVPLAAAASVVALVAGGVIGVRMVQPGTTPQAAGDPVATTRSSDPNPAAHSRPGIAELVTHEITGTKLQQFYAECVRDDREVYAEDTPIAFRNFDRPLFAFGIELPDRPGFPGADATAWLVAARGDGSGADERALCVRNQDGDVSALGPLASHAPKGDPYLYQVVDGRSVGAGFFVPPVATVTFQPKVDGAVETYAVVRDGMWFYPVHTPFPDGTQPPPKPDSDLIGLLGDSYRYRGYDVDGRLVYDSERDGPFVDDCHTDPSGQEVVHSAGKPDASPQTCEPTYEWTAP